MRADHVIIGSGINALVAGAMLALKGDRVLLLEREAVPGGCLRSGPLAAMAGICPGDRLIASGAARSIAVGDGLLGRVIDGLGRPIDGLGPLETTNDAPLQPQSRAAGEALAAEGRTGPRPARSHSAP